jgi:hypothetical protein
VESDAGIWTLQCRGCGHVFQVELGPDGEITRTIRAYPCPECITVPWNRPQALNVHWHDILDYVVPPHQRIYHGEEKKS